MRKISKVSILALGAIAAALLASCSPATPNNSSDAETSSQKGKDSESSTDSSEEDIVVASIKIVSDSIAALYSEGAVPNYNNLAIDLLNAGKNKIKTLKWADNKDSITYTEIDTSEVSSDRVFTVTYKEGDKTFTDSITYEVKSNYTFDSWAANANYVYTTGYTANAKISTSEDSLEQGIMKNAKFYVGNMNSVNLLPTLYGLDEDYEMIELSKIPNGATLSLSKDGASVAVNDYIDNAASFLRDGLLKFKDGVTGSFKVTLGYAGQKDIVYEMEVVDAYNVTKATDLLSFYTSVNSYPYSDVIANKAKEFKKSLGLPDAENLVLQNDVQIGKSSLPDFYFWSEGEGCDPAVVGSLKDWLRIYDHEFKNPGDTSTIYGNLHRISILEEGEDKLPYILTDSQTGQAQAEGKAISTHSALFYASYGANSDPFDCKIIFKDLQATGNNGVSEDTEIKEGGPMFLKSELDASFDNVNISKFYMAAMTDAADRLESSKKIGDKYVMPTLSFDSCRFRDLANAGVYLYGSGSMDIKNCDFAHAGGPLFFLNPASDEKLPSDANDVATYSPKLHTTVDIDDASFLSNLSAGKGGWFEAYAGASSLAGTLQSMDALFSPCSMSFLKEVDSVKKFNFVALNLPINSSGEGLGMPAHGEGGTNVTIRKNGKIVYSTLDGYLSVLSAALGVQTATVGGDAATIVSAYTAYAEALSGTFFGNNVAFANIAQEMVFTATDAQGNHESAMVNQDTNGNYFLCSSDYAIKNGFAQAGVETPSTYMPGDTFKSEGFLSCTINGDSSLVYPESVASNPLSYTGVSHYGVLLGNYHSI